MDKGHCQGIKVALVAASRRENKIALDKAKEAFAKVTRWCWTRVTATVTRRRWTRPWGPFLR